MAQFLIALTIFAGLMVSLYCVDRLIFPRPVMPPGGPYQLLLWLPDEANILLLAVLLAGVVIISIPVVCVYFVQRMMFGRERASATWSGEFVESLKSSLSMVRQAHRRRRLK
jgi:hypothetical protein